MAHKRNTSCLLPAQEPLVRSLLCRSSVAALALHTAPRPGFSTYALLTPCPHFFTPFPLRNFLPQLFPTPTNMLIVSSFVTVYPSPSYPSLTPHPPPKTGSTLSSFPLAAHWTNARVFFLGEHVDLGTQLCGLGSHGREQRVDFLHKLHLARSLRDGRCGSHGEQRRARRGEEERRAERRGESSGKERRGEERRREWSRGEERRGEKSRGEDRR